MEDNSAADQDALKWGPEVDSGTMYHIFDYGPWTAAGYLIPIAVWARGGAVIVNQGRRRHEALRDRAGTHALLLPFFLAEILAQPEDAFERNDLLQLYLAGGTVTETQLLEAVRRISPKVFNRLASTEAGGIACTPLNRATDRRWHAVLPERGVQIVDEDHQPVPAGRVGRLRVPVGNGPSEYYNDPDATAQFFRDGYFYSGDLAVARADGHVALEGRTSEVININGMKVAPARYEDQLRETYGFTGVCLFSAQDTRGEEQMYVVVESSHPLSHQVVKSLERAVSDLSLKVCSMTQMPRTGTGKVIRREIQARVLDEVAKVQGGAHALPRGAESMSFGCARAVSSKPTH